MIFFDPLYFVFLAPALILGLWAQYRVRSSFSVGEQMQASTTGAQAARLVLDSAGLYQVGIEAIGGHLTDHYDPQAKVLRLSPSVYGGRSLAAVGVAAHEAGHALQDAGNYAPLRIRNAAVGIANFGSGISWLLIALGLFLSKTLVWVGIAAFGGVVFYQLVNLPVEFDASRRAKLQLAELGIIRGDEGYYVSKVLNAAAWTYVAATLQSVLTLLYFIMRYGGGGRSDD